MSGQFDNEEALRVKRRQRMEEMHRSKEKQLQRRRIFNRIAPVAAGVLAMILLIAVGVTLVGQKRDSKQNIAAKKEETLVTKERLEKEYAGPEEEITVVPEEASMQSEFPDDSTEQDESGMTHGESLSVASMSKEGQPQAAAYAAQTTGKTLSLSEEIVSSYAVFIDLESDEILAQKSAKQIINPASMTKVLTILVAAEHVKDLDDTFTMTIDITDYSFLNDCSNAGFLDGEVITVRDLFYGTVLPSGGDAAVGLATYVAGSQEEFVKLMNQKLDDLGLSKTAHVTNCMGLYDANHYCTVYDMAMILEAAIENELCREVLSAHTYTTSVTEQHPEGILLSNWFLRRIEDKDTGGVVMCGKTGYVVESGNCAASYGIDKSGKGFVCVTADATSSWRCIYDHVALYKQFATEAEDTLSALGNTEQVDKAYT